MASLVYVPQEPFTRSPDGSWRRSMNLRPAEDFGELRFVLPGDRDVTGLLTDAEEIISELRDGLAGFDADRDYLLPLGNPLLIAVAGGVVAGLTGGRFRTLVWRHRRTEAEGGFYKAVLTDLWPPAPVVDRELLEDFSRS